MISATTRLALSLGLSLSLGFAFMHLGCGGKQKEVEYATADELVTVPDEVKEQLTECVKRGVGRLSETHYAVLFNVQADGDGDVRSVEIHDSILGDQAIEACMRRALQGMTLPSSIGAMRSARADGEGAVAPGSRALVGDLLVLGGATVALGPIVIVAAGVTVVVAVTIYILSEASKDADDTKAYCQNLLDRCVNYATQPKWNRDDFGWRKQCDACFRECKRHGAWPDYKCPFN